MRSIFKVGLRMGQRNKSRFILRGRKIDPLRKEHAKEARKLFHIQLFCLSIERNFLSSKEESEHRSGLLQRDIKPFILNICFYRPGEQIGLMLQLLYTPGAPASLMRQARPPLPQDSLKGSPPGRRLQEEPDGP